jgi:hypothetical protein
MKITWLRLTPLFCCYVRVLELPGGAAQKWALSMASFHLFTPLWCSPTTPGTGAGRRGHGMHGRHAPPRRALGASRGLPTAPLNRRPGSGNPGPSHAVRPDKGPRPRQAAPGPRWAAPCSGAVAGAPPAPELGDSWGRPVAERASDPLGAAPGDPSRRAAGRARRGGILPGPSVSAPTALAVGLGPWGRAVREFARFEKSTGFGQEIRQEVTPHRGERGGRRVAVVAHGFGAIRRPLPPPAPPAP